ncbi:MAG TPA: HoxN/HupN/NixA family nickel/cobalt transporter [Reyranella sp.]|nr:HoxN/HupN/NixA family nickel/cobalt transporter [Reyranella sp.]
MRARLIRLYAVLAVLNLAAWGAAMLLFDRPALWALALTAYGLGLRHSVDADHIAAIDNATRKLMQRGHRPVAVGLFFALGHSTVVMLAVLAVAAMAGAASSRFAALKDVSGLIGTSVSVLFLFAMAAVNFFILCSIWRSWRRLRSGESLPAGALAEGPLEGRGPVARTLRPLFRLVTKSWHMFPVGFLFGLGFDTATEVTLLGLAAGQAMNGLSLWSILVLPFLFAAGMSLVDATDGVLMVGAYDWALLDPARRLGYNLVVTLASIVVAVVVGGVEAMGIAAERFDLAGPVWTVVHVLDDHSGLIGAAIVGLFGLTWLVALLRAQRKRRVALTFH